MVDTCSHVIGLLLGLIRSSTLLLQIDGPSHRYLSTTEMLSGILIFNQKGENLIFRAFRNDCRPRLADVFRIQVISNAQVRSPILTLGSTTFSHVKHENIYLVAITKSNANAALIFEFLYKLVGLGRGYFGKFDEEAIKNNFVLVYELLDGILYSRTA